MASTWKSPIRFLATILLATCVNAYGAILYCSTENTGGNQDAKYSIYQSNGLCFTACANYAFAILQGPNCWCSNYAPETGVNTLSCNEQCPGYSSDWCGNTSEGLYGYYILSVSPSGTAGGATQTSSAPNSILSSSSSSTTAPPTQIYTSVQTVTGQVRTIVVTPTSTADPSSLGQGATNSGGVSTGKVVGIVLGVAIGLGILIGLGVWYWLRRRHQDQSRTSSRNGPYTGEEVDTSRSTPSRQVSQMSSSGLLGSRAPRIMTGGISTNGSNNPRSPDTVSSNGFDRRSLGTDQRLNPWAIYANEEARLSSVSLQDNQDYSRQLRIANPD